MGWPVHLRFRGVERLFGPNAPVFIAAEIGINHNGDMVLAKECIAAAASAGADGVKFQNYRTEDFLHDRTLMYEYVSNGVLVREPQYDMFSRCELRPGQLAELAHYAAEQGVAPFATPSGLSGVKEIREIGLPLLKNASDSLTNLDLVRAMGESGLPTVLSTGMATDAETALAVSTFRATGNDALVLVVCTSLYPTPHTEAHVRRVPALAARHDVPVGFSDHTEGPWASIAATALGACFIEKHFTLAHDLPGPDHRFSASPEEFAELVRGIRAAEEALGSSALEPTPGEDDARRQFAFSLCAARDLPAGHTLCAEDIALFRPGIGLPPQEKERLIGRCIAKSYRTGEAFRESDLEK